MADYNIPKGTPVTLTATANEGYEIKQMFVNNEAVTNPYTFNIEQDTEVYCTTDELFSLVVNQTGVTVSVNGTQYTEALEIEDGEEVTLTASIEEGWTLQTATLNGSAIAFPHTFTMSEDVVVVATAIQNFELTLTADEHATVTVNGQSGTNFTFPSGTDVTIVVTPNEGYDLTTFTVNGTTQTSPHTFTITETTTVVVATTIQSFDVTVTQGANTTVTVNGESGESFNFPYNTEVTIVATPATGYDLTTFTVGGTAVTSPHIFNILANSAVVTAATAQTFTVSVTENPNATIAVVES